MHVHDAESTERVHQGNQRCRLGARRMSVHSITLETGETVDLTVAERGSGRPFVLLHGGAGPMSVTGFAQMLADRSEVKVYTPTHPGFGGTPRPDWLSTVPKLAEVYARWLAQTELTDVTVIGNSIGGWIASELALRDSSRLRNLVLADAVGIAVEGHPVVDIFQLSPDELSKLSFHNPAAFAINPAALSEQQRAGMVANRVALAVYGGKPPKVDPTLRGRLGSVDVPTLVVWGDSDRVVDPDYGRAWADAIPLAEFLLLPNTGRRGHDREPRTAVGGG